MFCQECGHPLKKDEACEACGSLSPADDTDENGVSFAWNLNGFPESKKTEDINFNWNTGVFEPQEDGESMTDKSEKKELSPNNVENPLDELNKFFSFEEANKDFQKLLDKHYDNIKDYTEPQHVNENQIDLSNAIDTDIEDLGILIDKNDIAETVIEPDSEIDDDDPELTSIHKIEHKAEHKTESDQYCTSDVIDDEPEPEVIWIEEPSGDKNDADIQIEGDNFEKNKESETEDQAAAGDEELADESLKSKTSEAPLWFENNREESETKKEGIVVRTILVLIILILLSEATILGVQFFFPNSAASAKAEQINTTISGAMVDLKDRVVGLFGGKGKEDTDTGGTIDDSDLPDDGDLDNDEEIPEGPVKTPSQDKDALISKASHLNKNIVDVKPNDDLAWEENKKYGVAKINDSKPIEENHWYTNQNGEHIYYDEEIVATLIDFDSRWVEYVNGGSKDVISLTKSGSQARKNVETFSKVGKVNQTFLNLEIGEIRQHENFFYTWTYEEIKEIQDGKTTIKKYRWIYCLEPVNNEMKITNYYKY